MDRVHVSAMISLYIPAAETVLTPHPVNKLTQMMCSQIIKFNIIMLLCMYGTKLRILLEKLILHMSTLNKFLL